MSVPLFLNVNVPPPWKVYELVTLVEALSELPKLW